MADSQGSRDGDFSPGCSSVQQKSSNPESSCVSMKSDCSMDPPAGFKSEDTQPDLSSVQQKRSNPESSCVSMKSDFSMDPPAGFKSGDTQPDLRLMKCGVTDEGCSALASALRSNPSHLRELNVSRNNLGDSGMKLVSAVLENPLCKLEYLRFYDCGVTDEGCAALASALRSNPSSHLRKLSLSFNNLGDSGVKLVSAVLENPHCKLEYLGLSDCGVTDEGCAALASALRSNPSHLRELDMYENNLGDSEVKLLKDLKDDPHYKLEILRFR